MGGFAGSGRTLRQVAGRKGDAGGKGWGIEEVVPGQSIVQSLGPPCCPDFFEQKGEICLSEMAQ